MLELQRLLELPVIETLGWALLHFVWQGIGVALTVAVLLQLMRNVSARSRYLMLVGALGLMVACPVSTCWWLTNATEFNTPLSRPGPMAPLSVGQSNAAVASSDSTPSAPIADPPARESVVLRPTQPTYEHSVKNNSAATAGVSLFICVQYAVEPKLPWLVMAWFIGAAIMSVRLLLGWRMVQRMKLASPIEADLLWQSRLKELSKRLGLELPIRLVESTLVDVPTVIGWLRPTVLVPASLFTGLTREQLETVLLHELAHIRRHDYLVNLLQTAVEALLFYHPAIWWLSSCIRKEREHCCDDVVVALSGNRLTYAQALTAIEDLRSTKPNEFGAGLTMAADGGSLLVRIRRLAQANATPSQQSTWMGAFSLSLATLAAALALMVYLASRSPLNVTVEPLGSAGQNNEKQHTADRALAAESIKDDLQNSATRYSGRVTGPDQMPIAGARIYIVPTKGDIKELGALRAQTDENGHFDFDAPDMSYAGYDGLPRRREGLIFAIAEGFAPEWMETWGDDTSTFREYWTPIQGDRIELQLAAKDSPIHGTLRDADGQPLVDARVRVTALMVPRDRDLTAHLQHWSKASIASGFLTKVPDYKRELVRVNLLPGQAIETRTDKLGRFTINGLGRDRLVHLAITAPAVVDTGIEVMTREGEDVGTFIDFEGKPTRTVYAATFAMQLKRGLTVKGIVRDHASKAPVEGMWLTRYFNPLQSPEYAGSLPISDKNGRFQITGLDPAILNYDEQDREITAIPQPGTPYLQGRGVIDEDGNVVIDCVKGIPYRLNVVDDKGEKMEATVEYQTVSPNPLSGELVQSLTARSNWPVINRAALRQDSSYEGFVLPGPGAVLITMSNKRDYRAARVDPKAFFEPERTNWPSKAEGGEQLYGTHDTLVTVSPGLQDQTDFNAIVLVNPKRDSEPLELTATVFHDRPRTVSLVDTNGQPVVGVDSRMQWPTRESSEQLRSATFVIKQLDPERVKQMTFIKEDQQLIGFLLARGDGDSPYTVVMRPWVTVNGRFVDSNNEPVGNQTLILRAVDGNVTKEDWVQTGKNGEFTFNRVIPGLTYQIATSSSQSLVAAADGKELSTLTFAPGQTVSIGEIKSPTKE